MGVLLGRGFVVEQAFKLEIRNAIPFDRAGNDTSKPLGV